MTRSHLWLAKLMPAVLPPLLLASPAVANPTMANPQERGSGASSSGRTCEAVAESHVDRMTGKEKVGQMVMAVTHDRPGDKMPNEETRKSIQKLKVGSVIVYGAHDPSFAARYNNQLQRWTEDTRLGVPLLVSADFEYGTVHNVPEGTTTFPRQMGIGATHSVRDAKTMARITATEARAMGFHWNFSPVADVNTNPENPVIGVRSYGERTKLVRKLTAATVSASQKAGVVATAKHFPGHGDTNVDSHLGLPKVTYDRETLEKVHLPPFEAAIRAGTDAIMTAHIIVEAVDSQLPATLSREVLTGLLRGEMGYEGVIVTDAMTMNAIDENWGTRDATVMAAKAGADVIMSTGTYQDHVEAVDALLDALHAGELPARQVEDSAERVIELKCEYGLFEHRYVGPDRAARTAGNSAFQDAAQRIGLDSITLLKNEGVLPFASKSKETTFVAGVERTDRLADAVDEASQGPVTSWQASSHNPSDAEIQAAVAQARAADRVIVATYSASALPPGQAELVRALEDTEKPVAAVSVGLPYDVASYPDVGAYMASYAIERWGSPNRTAFSAAAEVVFGAQPGGKLPVTIGDLYPYGSGLRYH